MARHGTLIAFTVTAFLLATGARAGTQFQDINIHFEEHPDHGDGCAVVEVTSSGDGLGSLQVFAPDGRLVASYDAEAKGSLGSRTLRLESPQPYLDDLHATFPEGYYKFIGVTFEGEKIQGLWYLAHDVLPAPELRLEQDDPIIQKGFKSITAASRRIAWTAVGGAVGYEVQVVNGATGETLSVRVPAPKTSFTIPADWLEPGATYRVMVGTVGSSSNRAYAFGQFTAGTF